MATPNYGYEKRQRELAKKKKKEEKLRAKTHSRPDGAPDDLQPDNGQVGDDTPAADQPAGPAGA